jgi:hypothetical protein
MKTVAARYVQLELEEYVRPISVEMHCHDKRGKRTGIVACVTQAESTGYVCTIKEGGKARMTFAKRTFGGVMHALAEGDAVRERVPEGAGWRPVLYVPDCSEHYNWHDETA